MRELRVLINDGLVATVTERPNGNLVLTYDPSWQERADALPVSLSMPLSQREHADTAVRPFMEGLLPDNAAILERWARQFHVSPRNPFALLSHMGEDCAGAVQFVRPDRYEDIASAGEGDVEWLSERPPSVGSGSRQSVRSPSPRPGFRVAKLKLAAKKLSSRIRSGS